MKKTLYRIHVENVKSKARGIESFVNSHLSCYSVIHAIGGWNSVQEDSLIIEHIGDETSRQAVDKLALRLRVFLAQDCVIVTEQTIEYREFTR